MESRNVDHDEDVVVRGSGLDCSTDDHLDRNNERALGFKLRQIKSGSAAGWTDMRNSSWVKMVGRIP